VADAGGDASTAVKQTLKGFVACAAFCIPLLCRASQLCSVRRLSTTTMCSDLPPWQDTCILTLDRDALASADGLLEIMMRQVQALAVKFGDDEHPKVLTAMGNLAATLGNRGDLQGAETLERLVLDVRERILGVDHPDTLTARNNLAITLYQRGDHVRAEALQAGVLASREARLGCLHPETLAARSNMAGMAMDRALMQDMANDCSRALGKEHPYTAAVISNLAVVSKDQRVAH